MPRAPRRKPTHHASPGEGTLYYHKTKKLWVARATLGKDEAGHARVWEKSGKDKATIAAALADTLQRIRQGREVGTDEQTVHELVEQWLATVKETREPKTWQSYRYLATAHVLPYVGDLRLIELNPQHVQAMLSRLAGRDPPLSPRTRKGARDVLGYALQRAVAWGILDRNVARLAEPPKVPKSQIVPLSEADAKKLLVVVRGHPLEALYTVALALGARQGEALGLRWSDVDLAHGQVTIAVALVREDGAYRLKEIKTGERGRVLALPQIAMAALERRREIQHEERRVAGFGWKGNKLDLVFTTSVGTPLDRWNVRRQFHGFLAAAGLRRARFYDLRHTAASLLLAQGVDMKVISEILGHASIRTTMDVYTHLTRAQHQDAARRLNDILGG